MKNITTQFNEDLTAFIETEAKRQKRSRSQIVRFYVERGKAEAEKIVISGPNNYTIPDFLKKKKN